MTTPTNLESPPPRWRVAPYDPADAAPEGGEHRGRFPDVDMYAADCLGDTLDVEALAEVVLSADMPIVPVDVEVERDPCECDHDIVDHPTDIAETAGPVWNEARDPGACLICGCDGFTRPLPGAEEDSSDG